MRTARAYLVVDDDEDVLKAAAFALASRDTRVDAARAPDGLGARAGDYDAVLLDMNFALGERDGAAGLDALAALKAADPSLSVVLMTTFGGVALAVEALKRGGTDFILKPWRNDALVGAMQAAATLTAGRREAAALGLAEVERRAIAEALAACDGNVSRAAARLGLSRPALYRRMERHGL